MGRQEQKKEIPDPSPGKSGGREYPATLRRKRESRDKGAEETAHIS